MPSPGETGVTDQRRAADLLHEARERERAACLPEAIACYEAAVAAAERDGEGTILAEALRRLAVLRRHRSEVAAATALCQRSYEVARQAGNDLLAAEALNTLGGLHLSAGAPDDARRGFSRPSSSADRAARCARVWSRISASSRTSGANSTKPSRGTSGRSTRTATAATTTDARSPTTTWGW